MKYWAAATIVLLGAVTGTPAMAGKTSAVLALSWEPAFCEGNQDRRECAGQTEKSFEASNFVLHGLWPIGQDYCDVSADDRATDESGNWQELPALHLSDKLRRTLDRVMPGTQSDLDRHEWLKHGTCTKFTPENYFQTAVDLLQQVNGSSVARLFQSHIGQQLTAAEISREFDSAFGRGAGKRVKLSCVSDGDRQLIDEITIGLSDKYAPGTSLEDLIDGAGGTAVGCDGGIVDPVGYQ